MICNLWRVERDQSGLFKTFEFDLKNQEWIQVWNVSEWPAFPFFPIVPHRNLDCWKTIVRKAIDRCLEASGFDDLDGVWSYGYSESRSNPSRVKMRLYEKYTPSKESKYQGQQLKIKPGSMQSGVKLLIAEFYRTLYDPEIFSGAMAINYKRITFPTYLNYALYREGFLKVSQEHRNLLPLLTILAPETWHHDDLFSLKKWVNERKVIDSRSFRWLMKAPSTVVKSLLSSQLNMSGCVSYTNKLDIYF